MSEKESCLVLRTDIEPFTKPLEKEIRQLKAENKRLLKDREFLIQEYHFLCRKLTIINNVFGTLWLELRERNGDHQTIEQAIEEGNYDIYD